MQPIFEETFAAGQLPQGWYTDTFFPRYSAGRWDCRNGDGVVIPLPHDSWKVLRLEVDVIECGEHASAFAGGDTRAAITLTPSRRDAASLVYEWTSETLRAELDGVEVLRTENLWQSACIGSFHTGFRDLVVTRIAAFGVASTPMPEAPSALNDEYPLEVTVDFNDDLMACAWTHQTYDNLFKELKLWGTKRVSWIDLGRRDDDYFHDAPYGTGTNGVETFHNVGDIFTAAVEHAHKEGIELYGIFKPFDMAIAGITWPPLTLEAKDRGRIERIGGVLGWSSRLAAENQHLIMARKPSNYGPAKHKVWTRLDLVKSDDAQANISANDVTLLVSEDNLIWREYSGPIQMREVVEDYPIYQSTPSGSKPTNQTRRARVFRFENFEVTEPFFAIKVQGSTRSFSNRLCDLVHIFGENGEETHLTYALLPRRAQLIQEIASTPTAGPPGGFEFNRYPGSPSSANGSAADPIILPLALDRGANSYIAFGRGKDRGPLAAFSPSFSETRRLWMTWIEAMLDSGADGIDVRPGHHHADFAWIEYGFEEPVRQEMLKRTGVDIWGSDDFDTDQWRRIRGEGYTQFLREASQLTRARGKKFVAHIDGYFDAPPGYGGGMNILADWREWIEEGLLDGVTGKALWPASHLSREVLRLAHAHHLPVTFVPYCNNFFEDRSTTNHIGDSPPGCHTPVERFIEFGKQHGYDAFGFYECASALRASHDGSVGFRRNAEPLREVMQRHFK